MRQAELVDEREHARLGLAEELAAGVVGVAVRARDGLEPPAGPVARLEHAHAEPGGADRPRCAQARQSRPDDHDVGAAAFVIAHIL